MEKSRIQLFSESENFTFLGPFVGALAGGLLGLIAGLLMAPMGLSNALQVEPAATAYLDNASVERG